MDALARALLLQPAGRIVVGFSGGMDSTVLLHALANDPQARSRGLRAIHVHHGLNLQADAWAAHCEAACQTWQVPIEVVRVAIDRDDRRGPEGAARAVRLAAFRASLADDDVLALAHHRDDQAETVLLRLLRGAGGDGLAAMRRRSRLGPLRLWRPLLELPRAALRDYATAHGLHWIEDPSNADVGYDRNFLRHRVLPLLLQRWPQASRSLARSAGLLAEQAQVLDATTATMLDTLQVAPDVLSILDLRAQPRAQRARILRAWLRRLHGSPPPRSVLEAIERDLLPARHDGQARIAWAGIALQRWRECLHARLPSVPLAPDWSDRWDGRSPLPLPNGTRLKLRGAEAFDEPLHVRSRRGGERIRLPGRAHHHVLKHVLQDLDVPPWTRATLPLLFAGDGELLAAGDTILSARIDGWLREHGAHLVIEPAGTG